MVVGYNEAHLLEQCFNSVAFCDEIIYIDLGSTDGSISIAKKYTRKIHKKDRVKYPSGEYVHAEMVKHTFNDWVIFIDPDEKIDPKLTSEIEIIFSDLQISESIGAVLVPWVFYFKKARLRGTVWGANNKKFLLVNKQRFDFLPITHYGRKLKEGFNYLEIKERPEGNVLHHYWITSMRRFFEKHQRYLHKEGIDQFNAGHRISKKNVLLTPIREFGYSFIGCKGYKNGLPGILLSMFWAYYKTRIAIDILLIQRKNQLNLSKSNQ